MLKIFLLDSSHFKIEKQKEYEKFLLADEKKRLENIKSLENKINFLLARFLVRTELAKILNCKPQEIVFSQNENGRLEISSPLTKSLISFNISHSKKFVAVVISKYKVGIDVELFKKRDFAKIADYYFSAQERDIILGCKSDDEKKEMFYYYWTLHEAFIKCNGGSIFNKKPQFILNNDTGQISSDEKDYQFLSFNVDDKAVLSIAINVAKSDFNAKENYELFNDNLSTFRFSN